MKRITEKYLSWAIVFGGLFIGSVCVDIAQLVLGRGFSERVVHEYDVLDQGGKTWVAYRDPKVALTLITDTQCSACNTDATLVWLRRVIPTVSVSSIEVDSEAGRALVDQYGLSSVPAFLFSDSLTKTDFYSEASALFRASGKQYVLDTDALGIPSGRYLHVPEVQSENVILGNRDAALKVFVYSDFQCAACGGLYRNQIKKLLAEYNDRVAFVFKALPLEDHSKAPLLAAASLCANEQGKYFDYASALFTKQHDLETRANTNQELKNISWMAKLDWKPFSDCLDQHRYDEQVKREADEARSLGITATPATFIGDRFFSGAVEYEILRQAIDEELGVVH